MTLHPDTIAAAAKRIGITAADLTAVFQPGSSVTYKAGDFLFHESTPRQWLGIVIEGSIEILRGAQARSTSIATLESEALISEGVMLDDSPHATSAVTRQGATVWQITRESLESVRKDKPEIFYRIAGRVAARLSERLRHAAERMAGEKT
jgi:aspartate ammonia-lyase